MNKMCRLGYSWVFRIFSKHFFGTCALVEVLKNEVLSQSDHGLCHQTTVYRSRKFAKNQENTYDLGHTPMGAIIYKMFACGGQWTVSL